MQQLTDLARMSGFAFSPLRPVIALAAAALLPACEIGRMPAAQDTVTASSSFRADVVPKAVALDWWERFDDPAMAGLVQQALRVNLSLLAAEEGVVVLDERLRQARLLRSPTAGTSASSTVNRPAGRGGDPVRSSSLDIDASWEVDLFGQLSAAVRAAAADREAARQAYRDVAVTVASETALAYLDYRAAAARLAVAQANAESQSETVELIRTLLSNGRAAQLDLERAEALFRSSRAQIPVFEAARENALSRLAALLAKDPTAVSPALAMMPSGESNLIVPAFAGALSADTPTALLRRRPDVRLAEANVAAALALSENARRSLFPRISLTASGNRLFGDNVFFGNNDPFGYSGAAVITWAGPDFRATLSTIRGSDAAARQSIATYEQAVLNALRDTEIALTNLVAEQARRADLQAAFDAAAEAQRIATLRFSEGLDDYLAVLDAQRVRLAAEDQLVLNQVETARRAVAAYRALGGIWDAPTLTEFRQASAERVE